MISSLRARAAIYAPLAFHVVPTLVIGYGFVIPNSVIAGVNELTLGFLAAVLGFIPSYVVGIRLARRQGQPRNA